MSLVLPVAKARASTVVSFEEHTPPCSAAAYCHMQDSWGWTQGCRQGQRLSCIDQIHGSSYQGHPTQAYWMFLKSEFSVLTDLTKFSVLLPTDLLCGPVLKCGNFPSSLLSKQQVYWFGLPATQFALKLNVREHTLQTFLFGGCQGNLYEQGKDSLISLGVERWHSGHDGVQIPPSEVQHTPPFLLSVDSIFLQFLT